METIVGKDIQKAKYFLLNGDVVGIPTETVYGLAGNALNEEAVAKIYAVKQRPRFNPLIVHVADKKSIQQFAYIEKHAATLIQTFMPGPLTILLPKKDIITDIATAGSNKVAIRIPQHPLTAELLKELPFPLCAPSANPFGYVSPTTAQHVKDKLNGIIPYVLDGGAATVGIESTIVEVRDNQIIIHRSGSISGDDLTAATGLPVIILNTKEEIETPGQLKSHYATDTPLFRGNITDYFDGNITKKTAAIVFTTPAKKMSGVDYFVLSEKGNLQEAAANLFKLMRYIDEADYEIIIAEYVPDEGIGKAINDRLERAKFSAK